MQQLLLGIDLFSGAPPRKILPRFATAKNLQVRRRDAHDWTANRDHPKFMFGATYNIVLDSKLRVELISGVNLVPP